jgi:hypothetical protein
MAEADELVTARAKRQRELARDEYRDDRRVRAKGDEWPWDEFGAGAVGAIAGWFSSDETVPQVLSAIALGFLGALVWHFLKMGKRWAFNVPLAMHLDQREEIQRLGAKLDVYRSNVQTLQEELQRQQVDHGAELQRLRAKDEGISLKCSQIDFIISRDEDTVSVVAHIQWIVNGNTFPVRAEVAFFVPFGITQFSAGASLAPCAFLKPTYPRLDGQIDLDPKKGVGPGYMVFVFSRDYLTGLFSPHPHATLDEIFELLRESEMYFEIRDLANKATRPVQIDAPQTLQKRARRGGGIMRTDSRTSVAAHPHASHE